MRRSDGAQAESIGRVPGEHAEVEVELRARRRYVVVRREERVDAHLAIRARVGAPRSSIVAEQRERAAVEEEREQAGAAAGKKERQPVLGGPAERADTDERARWEAAHAECAAALADAVAGDDLE